MDELTLFGDFASFEGEIPEHLKLLLRNLEEAAERDKHAQRLHQAQQLLQHAEAEAGSPGHAIYCIYSALLYAAHQKDEPWPAIAALLEQAADHLDTLTD